MSAKDFVHLHVHTDYSILKSANQIPALAQKLKELEMKACAITDCGNLYGVLSFYYNMLKNGIQPIIGYEAYLTPGSRFDKSAALKSGELPYYTLVLLAENLTGYYNLVRLSSKAFTEGLHHKPRLDLDLLAENSAGLICLSSGLEGIVHHYLKQNRFEDALNYAAKFKDVFGRNNFFLEIQDHNLTEEKAIRQSLIQLSKKLDLNLVATNDVFYLTKEDAKAHEMMLCIGATKTIQDESRPKLGSDQYYLKSADEMWRLFGAELPESILKTIEISERCALSLPSSEDSFNLPLYPIPSTSSCSTTDEYFEKVVWDGFQKRQETVWEPMEQAGNLKYSLDVYRNRINIETDIIRRMGFPGYFLIVWDFVRFAKENDIPVGPGRGSAAGSLVAYCLEITDVDPIQYDLLFERFLNPERVTMPDIDIDFCIRGREHVIRHVVDQYGRNSVCQIITFGTMASKAVIKDVGRALNMPYGEVEKIAKLIPPPVRGRNVSITQALEQVEELKNAVSSNPQIKELIDLARRLEGCARHTSVHAAGVVISPKPLDELIPVAVSIKEELTTQFAMSDLEKTGMLKMDFLALTTLTVINDCLSSIKQSLKKQIDWAHTSLSDEAAMKIFADGRTEAIFQFESPGMQEICRRLKPKGIEDLAALNALYRPGPLDGGMVDDFINRHRGQKQVRYLVPQMKEILNNTHGIIVYQEQIMQLAQNLAGYTLGEADMMRRAMGKKKREEMAKHQEKFVNGAVQRNIKREKAEQIFSLMAQFADYGFNKSHSVAYAYLAFQTAYLKAHFPSHFYAAVLSHEAQDTAKIQKYIAELKTAGIQLLPPDINESNSGFTPVQDAIRFGLSAIKGIGEAAIQEIITARQEKPFSSFLDFISRASNSVNRRTLQSLIYSGAFDSLKNDSISMNVWRSKLIAEIETSLSLAQKERNSREKGQNALFAGNQESEPLAIHDYPVLTDKEIWTAEKETLGFYLSSHPLSKHDELLKQLQAQSIVSLTQAASFAAEQKIWIAGVISEAQVRLSKKGNRFSIFKLEDYTGSIKCLAWSEAFEKFSQFLNNDEIIFAAGRLECENETSFSFIIEEVYKFEEALPARADSLFVKVPPATDKNINFYETLLALLNRNRGKCEVFFEIPLFKNKGYGVRLGVQGSLRIQGNYNLAKELERLGCVVEWQIRK
ncbi:MAG: DNA polymerase III subunit alpha [Acidobacteriota bacterium]|nr:DNA polymerase III subunit alpha [Acidobacteriota bacterium]